jgi:uncharacterized protein YjbJ (UPF0337 family)
LRHQLEQRRQARVLRCRFRKDPGAYLDQLKRLALQRALPSWFFWNRPEAGGVPSSALRCSAEPTVHDFEERYMDDDRMEGDAKKIKGNVKEGAGDLTGNDRLRNEGKADKAEGKVQKAVGDAKDYVKDKLNR